jgi:hypothetical protein
MSMHLTKGEKAIALSAVAVVAVFLIAFTQLNKRSKVVSTFETDSKINYNMARPEQPYAEYTIEGRQIDQYYESLPPSESTKAISKRKKDLIAKKQTDIKKKDDLKKRQAVTAKQKAAAQARAKQQQQQQAKVSATQEDLKNRLKDFKDSDTKQRKQSNEKFVFANGNNAPVSNQNPEVKPKNKKTFADWRDLIFATPTSDSIGQFIGAFRKSEVSVTELQAMATDLLDQEQSQLKGLGLMILRSVPSLESLSQLVHVENLPSEFQSYLEQAYITYFYPQNLTFLNAALATRDRQLVTKVLNLLNTNLGRLRDGDQSGFIDPRNRRNGEVSNFSMANFVSLIPNLGALSNSEDAELRTLAQQISTIIQSSNTVAEYRF